MTTKPDNREAVKTLFAAALEENPADRSRFLGERCSDASVCAEVERLLAEHEAEDQELRERVAVKTIRPEILLQPDAMTRFRREVHLARQVTHPNVCRIFDLFRKSGTGGP